MNNYYGSAYRSLMGRQEPLGTVQLRRRTAFASNASQSDNTITRTNNTHAASTTKSRKHRLDYKAIDGMGLLLIICLILLFYANATWDRAVDPTSTNNNNNLSDGFWMNHIYCFTALSIYGCMQYQLIDLGVILAWTGCFLVPTFILLIEVTVNMSQVVVGPHVVAPSLAWWGVQVMLLLCSACYASMIIIRSSEDEINDGKNEVSSPIGALENILHTVFPPVATSILSYNFIKMAFSCGSFINTLHITFVAKMFPVVFACVLMVLYKNDKKSLLIESSAVYLKYDKLYTRLMTGIPLFLCLIAIFRNSTVVFWDLCFTCSLPIALIEVLQSCQVLQHLYKDEKFLQPIRKFISFVCYLSFQEFYLKPFLAESFFVSMDNCHSSTVRSCYLLASCASFYLGKWAYKEANRDHFGEYWEDFVILMLSVGSYCVATVMCLPLSFRPTLILGTLSLFLFFSYQQIRFLAVFILLAVAVTTLWVYFRFAHLQIIIGAGLSMLQLGLIAIAAAVSLNVAIGVYFRTDESYGGRFNKTICGILVSSYATFQMFLEVLVRCSDKFDYPIYLVVLTSVLLGKVCPRKLELQKYSSLYVESISLSKCLLILYPTVDYSLNSYIYVTFVTTALMVALRFPFVSVREQFQTVKKLSSYLLSYSLFILVMMGLSSGLYDLLTDSMKTARLQYLEKVGSSIVLWGIHMLYLLNTFGLSSELMLRFKKGYSLAVLSGLLLILFHNIFSENHRLVSGQEDDLDYIQNNRLLKVVAGILFMTVATIWVKTDISSTAASQALRKGKALLFGLGLYIFSFHFWVDSSTNITIWKNVVDMIFCIYSSYLSIGIYFCEIIQFPKTLKYILWKFAVMVVIMITITKVLRSDRKILDDFGFMSSMLYVLALFISIRNSKTSQTVHVSRLVYLLFWFTTTIGINVRFGITGVTHKGLQLTFSLPTGVVLSLMPTILMFPFFKSIDQQVVNPSPTSSLFIVFLHSASVNSFNAICIGWITCLFTQVVYAIFFRGMFRVIDNNNGVLLSEYDELYSMSFGKELSETKSFSSGLLAKVAAISGSGFWTSLSFYGPSLHLLGLLCLLPTIYQVFASFITNHRMKDGLKNKATHLPLVLFPIVVCRGIPSLVVLSFVVLSAGIYNLVVVSRQEHKRRMYI